MAPFKIKVRKLRTLVLLFSVIAFFIYFFTSSTSESTDFYAKTVSALNNRYAHRQDQAAREAAKAGLNSDTGGAPRPREEKELPHVPIDIPVPAKEAQKAAGDRSVAGRKTMKGGEKWDMATGKEAAMQFDKEGHSEDKGEKSPDEQKLDVELNGILKKGPIIIFSKTYCPYSAKAKQILLEKYTIVPAPVIIEIDEHYLGPSIQDALGKSTGRRTVPNILVNGKSIGGGDEVGALDGSEELCDKLRSMGGKRVLQCKLASESNH